MELEVPLEAKHWRWRIRRTGRLWCDTWDVPPPAGSNIDINNKCLQPDTRVEVADACKSR